MCVILIPLLRIVTKMLRLLAKIEGFGGIPGPQAYQIKNEYDQRQRLRHINSLPKVQFSDLSVSTKPQRIES